MDTLVSMRTFRSVAELGSFVAASKRMGMSPAEQMCAVDGQTWTMLRVSARSK